MSTPTTNSSTRSVASVTHSAPNAARLPFFSSLRWRMTAWYGGLLALFVLAFAGAVYLEASRVVWSVAAHRVDGVAQEIESFVRAEANDPFGPVSAITALSDQSMLDTFAGPGLFVEVYNPAGYRIARTTNLGEADLPKAGYRQWRPPADLTGLWGTAQAPVGPVLARISTIRAGTTAGSPIATVYVAGSLQ